MPIKKLDHVNIRTTQLEAMIDWYRTILGMQLTDRPDFPFPGAWLCADGQIAVHLVGIDGDPAVGSEAELKLEHFAFSATDRPEFESRLEKAGERFQCSKVPSVDLVQYNIWDPDGNHIHVDFDTSK